MTIPQPHIPTETSPQPVPGHPGWVWWPGEHGHPHARGPGGEVQAHHFTALLARIRKAEGTDMDSQIAELQHLFPAGWVFGTVWQSVPSGPGARNLTAQRVSDGMLLAAGDVPSLAEKIRREEAGG